METKRPHIRVCACRHVSAPDHPEAGRRLLPLVRGPVTIQVVRDPMRGSGLPRGFGLLGRSGAPAVRAARLFGTRVVPGPFPIVSQVWDCCREIRTPDHRGPAVWTLSRITTRPLPRHSKRGYPSPGVPTGTTIRDTLIGVLRSLWKTQTHVKRLSPRRPTACFPSGRKERTQRSPACGPFASPSNPRNDFRLARGSLSSPLGNLRLARG